MRVMFHRIRAALIPALVVLAAGCAATPDFVYQPNYAQAGAAELPVKAAVLPFTDGTENFIMRGSAAGAGQYNLAKTGVPGVVTALTPEFWGKAFADELATSGSFRSVRFIAAPSGFPDADFTVDGTLKTVNYAITADSFASEFHIYFRAMRRIDKKVVWEKEVGKSWMDAREVVFGGALSGKSQEIMQVRWNRWIGGVLAEARADLVAAIASANGGAGRSAGSEPAGASPGESVDRTIDRILKGK